MELIERFANALADPHCENCDGDGIDEEGTEWTLCECALSRLQRIEAGAPEQLLEGRSDEYVLLRPDGTQERWSSREAFLRGCHRMSEQLLDEARERKSVSDQSGFCPVVPRWNPALGEDRIELHWYGWGGPIDALPPLCDLTRAQAQQLVQRLRALIESASPNPMDGEGR